MSNIYGNIREAIRDNTLSRIAKRGSGLRANPSFNLPGTNTGYSGDTVIRKTRDGSVRHGIKYGNEWFYRKYTKSGDDEFDITELIGVERIESKIFKSSLYGGKGWQIAKDDKGHFTLEIDNIIARRSMRIWELIINRLRAHNGTVIVGSSAKVESYTELTYNTFVLKFENETSNAPSQPFKAGDIIASKRFWFNRAYNPDGTANFDEFKSGAEAIQIIATVNSIGTDKDATKITVTLDMDETYGNMAKGLDFVRVASSDTKRQGLVVISSDGNEQADEDNNGVPFIDVYGGLVTYQNFLSALDGDPDYVKVRIGKLDALTGNTDEYGVWTKVIHLVGSAVEGANNIHSGTRAQFNALTSTITDTYHVGDIWIMTDEQSNIYSWNPDGVDVVGVPNGAFGTPSQYLTVGIEYTIKTYAGSDDFTNVGAPNNNNGTTFRATGAYPYVGANYTWEASTLTQYWVDNTNESVILGHRDVVDFGGETWLDPIANQITVLEKSRAYDALEIFTKEHTDLLLEASTWGVSSTDYVNAYNAVVSYMAGISWEVRVDGGRNPVKNWTTPVDGSVWISTWGTLYDEYANLKSDIKIQIDAQVYTDANGRLYKAPSTGVAGLFAGSTHLGYHNGAGVWNTYMDNSGQLYCIGALGTALWWKPADTALYIGDVGSGGAYLKAIASTAQIQFFDDSNVNVMSLGSDLIGNHGGVDLKHYGMVYKKINTGNNVGVSTVHSELYSQTTKHLGGLSSLVSMTTDILTPDFSTLDIMSAFKGYAYGAVASGDYVAGGQFRGTSVGAGNGVGVHSTGSWAGVLGIGGLYGVYSSGTLYVNGKIETNGNLELGNVLYPGGQTSKFLDYDVPTTKFTFNDDLYIGGNLTLSGTVDGVDVSALKALTDNMNGHGFLVYLTSSTSFDDETKTLIWTRDWEDSFGASECFGTSGTTFTCRYTGRYHLSVNLTFNAISLTATVIKISIVTTGGTREFWIDPEKDFTSVSGYSTYSISSDFEMTSGNSAYVTVQVATSTATILNGLAKSTFSGHLTGIDS